MSPWLKFWGTFLFLGGQKFVLPSAGAKGFVFLQVLTGNQHKIRPFSFLNRFLFSKEKYIIAKSISGTQLTPLGKTFITIIVKPLYHYNIAVGVKTMLTYLIGPSEHVFLK